MAKISIIVAVYNVAPYLRRSMDCLINQTMDDLEFICVDDCSTDNSLSILREYETKDSRFKIITSEVNGGAAVARNKGLKVATGEYLGFIDPDDTIDLNYYEELYKKAKEANYDIVKCQRVTINNQNTKVSNLNKYISKYGLSSFGNEWTTAIYRSSIVFNNNIEFPDEIRKGQDTVFLYRVMLKSDTIALIDNVSYYYYRRDNSLNADELSLNSLKSALKALNIVLKEINKSNLYEKSCDNYIRACSRLFRAVIQRFLFRNQTFAARKLCVKFLIDNYRTCKSKEKVKENFKPEWMIKYLENNQSLLLVLCLMMYRTGNELLELKPIEKMFSIKNKMVKKQKYIIVNVFDKKFEYKLGDDKLIEKIFSVKNKKINKRKYKVITILGIKIKFRKKEPEKNIIQNKKNNNNRKLIAVCGFWCSGSSTVCDMLSEFRNTTSFSHRKIYSGNINIENNTYCEIKFFQEKYSILKLVSSFKTGNSIEQDYAIRKFIELFYRYHDENKDNPLFQNDFLKINTDFLENILELDNYTKSYMKNRRYPVTLSREQDTFEGCCFLYKYPSHPYVFYKFKKLSGNEFNKIVSGYFNDFFSNMSGSNNLILDQLFSFNSFILDKMNFYMKDNPIKEICVWRDPRDQYINLLKGHPNYSKVAPEDFILWHQKIYKKLQHPSKNRLFVRFEDMVLNYDETVKKIIDFLGLDEKDHIYKKQIFIPEKSKVNIGEYKEFHDQKIFKEIEEELKDYLYK